jgi:hypothetical protein
MSFDLEISDRCMVETLPWDCWDTVEVEPIPTVSAPNVMDFVSLKLAFCIVFELPTANLLRP